MKDYSEFIKEIEGYVTGYDIEAGQLKVHNPKIKRNEPQIYPANLENTRYYDKRMEFQYKKLISEKDEIIKYKRKGKIIMNLVCNIILATIISILILLYSLNYIIGIGLFLLTSGSIALLTKKQEDKFIDDLKQYESYIEKKERIEELEKTDPNITRYLNEETLSLIEENKKLKEQQIIDSTFNINLMDKMQLAELRTLVLRYDLCEGLQKEQYFQIPSSEHKSSLPKEKVRKRTKNNEQIY